MYKLSENLKDIISQVLFASSMFYWIKRIIKKWIPGTPGEDTISVVVSYAFVLFMRKLMTSGTKKTASDTYLILALYWAVITWYRILKGPGSTETAYDAVVLLSLLGTLYFLLIKF